LHLLNSEEIQQKVSGPRSESLAQDDRGLEEVVRELYLVAFSREPKPEEMATAVSYVQQKKENSKQAFEDILWALMNTKEFVFNH